MDIELLRTLAQNLLEAAELQRALALNLIEALAEPPADPDPTKEQS